MPRRGNRRILISAIVIFVLFCAAALVFFSSPPVLIVGDPSFERLYGQARLNSMRIELSLRLFRRVMPVTVAETAGVDLMAIAVDETSRAPGQVIFPYRYLEAGLYYREKHPDVPVFVAGGPKPRGEARVIFLQPDTESDLYRAGLIAALLAGDKRIIFFSENKPPDPAWEALKEGIEAGNHGGLPIFVNTASDYSSYSDTGCVILAGPALKFLERNLEIPVILFSWLDPDMTSKSVKVVFDDSTWALAAEAVKKPALPGDEIFVSSRPFVLPGSLSDKKDFRNIRRYVKEEYQKK